VNKTTKISDLVEVPQVRTVVRIEEGRTESLEIADSFIFTSEVASHFAVLADSLLREHGSGYFLQGDFGSGKSHVLAALTAWAAGGPGADALAAKHAGLKRVSDTGKRFLPVDISLVRHRSHTALEQIIAGGIEEAVASTGVEVSLTAVSRFRDSLEDLLKGGDLLRSFSESIGIEPAAVSDWLHRNPREAYLRGAPFLREHGVDNPDLLVEDRHEIFAGALSAARAAGFSGIILLIDELSEFFGSKRDASSLNEDARTLQYLGELSQTEPVWIIAAVQESIERTGDLSPATFRKIGDRYPVKLALSTVHIKSLIRDRLVHRKPGAEEQLQRIYETYRREFTPFSWTFDEFRTTYPVHPATVDLLDGLGDLFSVHRGIVDFVWARLAGDPERHIPGIMDRPALELLAPDSIYDHFAVRMGEFSAFHMYPRHIVPHLDEVADSILNEPEDRALAKRLVRILVLYRIHPTASDPSVRKLAELVGCALAFQNPEMNVEYISETILDPLASESRFLAKQASSDDKGKATYAIITQDDPGKSLKSRVDRAMREIADADTRILTEALRNLPESVAWPGRNFMESPSERTVNWLLSSRRVLTAFLHRGAEEDLEATISEALGAGSADMAVVFCVGETKFRQPHTAVWQIPMPAESSDDRSALTEYLAIMNIGIALKPGHAVEGALIPIARERLRRQAPAAQQAALNCVYAGAFNRREMQLDTSEPHMQRLDHILQIAAERILEERYPRFRDVAPRRVTPFPRIYQRLLDEFVFPGAISMRDARGKGISEFIEGLAIPLGLATARAGSYVAAPDPGEHPLLRYLFTLLKPSGPTPIADVLRVLKTGEYGLPDDTSQFLLAALAIGGAITLLKSGRSLPLDFLRLASADSADAVAPGEVIGQGDRETLLRECSFLLDSDDAEPFGLRQQREAWQAAIRMKRSNEPLITEIRKGLSTVREYSAFSALDTKALENRLTALSVLDDEIKVSYQPREGLERFLRTWRGSGLKTADIAFLKTLRKFLAKNAEQVVFMNHYVRHRAAERISELDEKCGTLRETVLHQLKQLETIIAEDRGEDLENAFCEFRERYLLVYGQLHEQAQRKRDTKPLSKFAKRALAALQRLSGIDSLDRPAGLDELVELLRRPSSEICGRGLREELLRSAVCSCGYQPGIEIEDAPASPVDIEDMVARLLGQQILFLREPGVREAISARAYVLQDSEPSVSHGLGRLARALEDETVSSTAFLDMLDEETIREVNKALAGRVSVEKRDLGTFFRQLAGRRLTASQVREATENWVGDAPDKTLLALDGQGVKASADTGGTGFEWWRILHSRLFSKIPGVAKTDRTHLTTIETALETAFPSSELRVGFDRLNDEELGRFIVQERFHLRAVRVAWTILAERIVNGSPWPAGIDPGSLHPDEKQSGFITHGVFLLHDSAARLAMPYPARCGFRVPASELLAHPWATAELQKALYRKIEKTAREGDYWLRSIPGATSIDLTDNPLVVVLDAVPPDVWVLAKEILASTERRIESVWLSSPASSTVESLQNLLGTEGDPADVLPSRGIPYHHVSGNEERTLKELLSPLDDDSAVVVRIAFMDREAHRGSGPRLHEMPEFLARIFSESLLPLAELCRERRRRMVITADHGLTLSASGLTHGRGGVYEQAVFLVEFP